MSHSTHPACLLIADDLTGETAPPKPQIRDAGLRHIAFLVDDLDTAYTEFRAVGIQFEPAPVVLPGMRLFFFRDVEGNYLHLVQREKALL